MITATSPRTKKAAGIPNHNGDSAYVPMNRSINQSVTGKLSARLFKSLKVSRFIFLTMMNGTVRSCFKYNPDGVAHSVRNTEMYAVSVDQLLSRSLFHEFKISYMRNDYGYFVYETPWIRIMCMMFIIINVGPGFYTAASRRTTRRITERKQPEYDLICRPANIIALRRAALYPAMLSTTSIINPQSLCRHGLGKCLRVHNRRRENEGQFSKLFA
jgi:hypothetical protein